MRKGASLLASVGIAVAVLLISGCAGKQVVYRRADPSVQPALPRDNCAHPDFRTEWWYFTGLLRTDGGRDYAFELTFFRRRTDQDQYRGLPVRRFSNPANMAHFAMTDETAGTHRFAEKRTQDYIDKRGNAGALEDMLYVWNEGWSMRQIGDGFLIKADMKGYDLTLLLTPNKPPVLHGENGYFAKGEEPGQGSYYISYTNMEASGVLFADGRPYKVQGRVWHDHEYGSHQMRPEQRGWDWFSIRLENDVEIMLYLLTLDDGGVDPISSGTIVPAEGGSIHLRREDFSVETRGQWTSSRTKTTYPAAWRITIPSRSIDLEITPTVADQEMITRKTLTVYWEGSVRVSGTYEGRPVQGRGFVELVGYNKPFKFLSRLAMGSLAG